MSPKLEISSKTARKLGLRRQLLADKSAEGSGADRVTAIIERLGYVQIDTISVVRRAHHHTLWSRYPNYEPELLNRLLAVDRKIFEYWGHAASYLPMTDYRYYTARMRRFRDPMQKWVKNRLEKCGHLMEPVLERIRAEGPLGSRDFKSNPGVSRDKWWDWKPAKTALELLFWRGELMITRRDGFQRIYDLTERVLPEDVDTTVPNDDELGRFLVRRALDAHGFAREKTIVDHIQAAGRKAIKTALSELTDSEEIVQVSIDGREEYYANRETLENIEKELPENSTASLHILSPFDNLLIQRDRVSRLFGFDYVLECYKPREKREYGYFVLPVMWRNGFVARMDARADRKKKILHIIDLWLEPGFNANSEFVKELSEKLSVFASFNGCTRLAVEKTTPGSILELLWKQMERNELERSDD
ncbi:MAG: hypothetical protein GF388_11880 [Candidatus Aegiribacteria sp.]|nr:hypothetical protein [Candidatus Aegiribacteria sp.]MBD3295667.1 hypothetical protein [Candidatus Fermentibacteria bacterium]